MIPAYQLLAERIREDLSDMERCVRRAERAWQAAERAQSDT